MIRSFPVSLFTAPLDLLYWIKWWVAYICIRLHNARHGRRFDLYDITALGDPVKLGVVAPRLEKQLEAPCTESHLQEAVDEVLFYGVNSKSECVLVRVSRRPNQTADAWIYLKLANGKSYSLVESAGHQQPYEGDKCANFSCGGLQMHYLAPMRRWRIFYCGMLREISATKRDAEETVFVKFVFLWRASSEVYDFTLDSNPTGFANSLAKTQWSYTHLPPLEKVVESINFYAQSGVIHGTVSIDDGDDIEVYLFGEKMRSLGKLANVAGGTFTNILGNTPANGFTFHLGKASAPYIFNDLPYGFMVTTSGFSSPLKEVDINIQPHSNESERTFEAGFSSVLLGGTYQVQGHVLGDPIVLGHGWSGFAEVSIVEFTVGGKRGSGLIICGEAHKEPRKIEKAILETPFPERVPLVAPFSDDVSHFGEISGGKGSSLGKLTKLSKQERSFTVPKGIVVTTAAYKEFLTPEILNAIKQLENIVYGNVKGDVKEACNTVSDIITRSLLPQKICSSITEELKQLFGEETVQRKFAVRSSATGEDTAAMSAAGQMDTFLGIQGLQEIFLAVKKCWASQFGHIAVEYKKRYGQPLNCPMAVVVQEMVACQVSGVLFTCDPVTNNPAVVTITANYGLGETVVSGSVEPDTITLKRDVHGELHFESCLVGAKHQKLVLQESGGTVTEDIPEESRGESCLAKELAELLGKISLKIEEYYRSSRDIEWGIVNGNIYILQSRPVSNAAAETEYEMKHEFDAPLRCEGEYFTVANVGEVMPGATSPLGFQLLDNWICNVIKRQLFQKGILKSPMLTNYLPSSYFTFYNHMTFNLVELMFRNGVDSSVAKGLMISVFGRFLDDPELLDFAREKKPFNIEPTLRQFIQNWKDLYFLDWSVEKVKRQLDNYHLNFLKHQTAKETFAAILKSCSDFDGLADILWTGTESSSDWNMSLLNILCDANGGSYDSNVYSDFARVLASTPNVESANIPQAMQEVALQIVADIGSKQFKSMSVEDALQWLQTSTSQSGCKFREFIKRHGSRCLKEGDVISVTWEMDSKPLVELLQNLSETVKENEKKEVVDDFEKLCSDLHVPLGIISKMKLRFIVLPNCRNAIRGREVGKALSVHSMAHWRLGFRRLAQQMASEGRIPDQDLLFFLGFNEIAELLETRSPALIARALSRRKIFPILDDYKFPEIMRGIPKPINEKDESSETFGYVADLMMKGTPVSQGVTRGYARVAMTLKEASHLQKGEILITYGTDIGWSPYFSIVSGVVTELGGLISHGAVVCREYGLPCVVGMQGATKRFQTGDYVLLDGKKGILQRLPKPENG